MYTPPYDRLHPPEDMNHKDFGKEVPTAFLSGPKPDSRLAQKVMRLADLKAPASEYFGYSTTPSWLQPCTAKAWAAYSKRLHAQVFLPDHATMAIDDEGALLIEDTIWHTHLFFVPQFRNDHGTNWKWLTNLPITPDVVVNEPANYCYHRFHNSYFHWFMDVLPHVWFLKKHSPYGTGRKWFCGPVDSAFKIESLKAFGIGPEDLLDLPREGVIDFADMVTTTFTFEEPLKTRPSFHNGIHHIGWSRDYQLDLRDAVLKHFGIINPKREKRYYLSREDAWHRKVRNEDEVLDLLKSKGFEVVVPGNMSFEEQVRTFSNADVVIGPHGAGFTNMLWSPTGMRLVEFIQEEMPDVGYRFTANMLNQKHYSVACEWFDHQFGVAYADVKVDMDVLRQILDHLKL